MPIKSKLSLRYRRAMDYAFRLHRDQKRKGTEVPYISHLTAVSSIVLEYGGNEKEAIAALLHDAVEDQGGKKTLKEIQKRFGYGVANIVWECSDAYTHPKPPWRQRKEEYLAHLPTASPSTLLVSAADKLHNASTILKDYRDVGEEVWKRFKGGREGTLWYYRQLANIFLKVGNKSLAEELDRVVAALEVEVNKETEKISA